MEGEGGGGVAAHGEASTRPGSRAAPLSRLDAGDALHLAPVPRLQRSPGHRRVAAAAPASRSPGSPWRRAKGRSKGKRVARGRWAGGAWGDGTRSLGPASQVSVLERLMSRETKATAAPIFTRACVPHRFRNFRFQGESDTHDPSNSRLKLQFLRRRSRIVEIVAAGDVVFALTQTGVCAAFRRRSCRRLCLLNVSPDEVIRSLFYNKWNNSLITVSVYRYDNFSSLRCRSTPIPYFERGQPELGFELFQTESLKWPGFVEFDDVNGKVLTYSATAKTYKVWDLVNYTLRYALSDEGIQETKISPGVMLLVYNRAASGSHIPLKLVAIDSGRVLKSFNHLLVRQKRVEFIELFNEKMLVKQEDSDLQIVDVRDGSIQRVPQTRFFTPSAFIFLYENQRFLTFRGSDATVWDFRGNVVSRFEDHVLWHNDCNTNNIYITMKQDLIVSYCKSSEAPGTGTINISRILDGRCVAKIPTSLDGARGLLQCRRRDAAAAVAAGAGAAGGAAAESSGRAAGDVAAASADGAVAGAGAPAASSSLRNNYEAAADDALLLERFGPLPQHSPLEEVTSLFFNEDRNEVYTGNRNGVVRTWSNS